MAKPKRTLELEGTGLPPLVISKVIEVDMPKKNFFIEELLDGTFRITYSKSLLPDLSKLEALRILREEIDVD